MATEAITENQQMATTHRTGISHIGAWSKTSSSSAATSP